jgi:GT2 family glycosyltransferase
VRVAARAPSYAVGIVNYRNDDELRVCLKSVGQQTLAARACVVIDHGGEAAARARLAREFPQVGFRERPNRGYAGGANAALEELASANADFFLLLNPDLELEPTFAERLVRALADAPEAAIAGGKLLRRDGTIDSAGIVLPWNRRPRDRGSGEVDRGQYDRAEPVFGASGAAMLLRTAALGDLRLAGEIFDEDFFLYHEDTDLSWRAGRLGWQVLYVPSAVALHERRWQRERRFEIEVSVRRHSFKNHYLQIAKNERAWDLLLHLPILLGWEVLRLGFALLRDPAILPAYGQALRRLPRALGKRRELSAKAARRR